MIAMIIFVSGFFVFSCAITNFYGNSFFIFLPGHQSVYTQPGTLQLLQLPLQHLQLISTFITFFALILKHED